MFNRASRSPAVPIWALFARPRMRCLGFQWGREREREKQVILRSNTLNPRNDRDDWDYPHCLRVNVKGSVITVLLSHTNSWPRPTSLTGYRKYASIWYFSSDAKLGGDLPEQGEMQKLGTNEWLRRMMAVALRGPLDKAGRLPTIRGPWNLWNLWNLLSVTSKLLNRMIQDAKTQRSKKAKDL